VLHYWSLSVEEQFYLVWPLLLFAALRVRRGAWGPRTRIRWAVVLAIVGISSLVYSLVSTPRDPAIAYFATTTRVWEFAAGAAVALLVPRLVGAPRIAALGAGVAGLAAVVVSAVVYSPTTEFPGTAALAPVIGTALVIAAGVAGPLAGVGALLTLRPLRFLGRISYSLYLWHWPCLVFARTAHWAPPDGQIGWIATTAALAIAFVLAVATYALVENPLRHATWLAASRRRTALIAAMATSALVGTAIAGGALSILPSQAASAGAAAPPAATPAEALSSTAYTALHGCHLGYSATTPAPNCVFGDVRARRTVVLLGDSHAAQWFPALEELGVREHFRLVSWTKSGCPFAPHVHLFLPAIGRDYTECLAWQSSVTQELRALAGPAIVIVGRTSTYLPQVLSSDGAQVDAAQAPAIWGAGMATAVRTLRPIAARVIVLRDTPHPPFDVPACISWDTKTPSRCDFPRSLGGLADTAEYTAEVKAGVPRELYANPTSAACPASFCRAVVNGVITYRDDNHLTAAYVATRWRAFQSALHFPFGRRQI
jgi:hypothetical protein